MGERPPGREDGKWKARAAKLSARLKPSVEAVVQRAGMIQAKFNDDKNWEVTGERISRRFIPAFERGVERRVRRFDIQVQNEQNLEALQEQSHIVVANHPYPQDKISLISGISPDSAVLFYVIRKATGENVHFLSHYGEEPAPFIKNFPDKWQNRWKRTHKGIIRGSDMLSVDTAPGVLPTDFVKEAEQILASGDSIFIYP